MPFCGRNRQEDLEKLRRVWRHATEPDGEPQVVVLLAESGMGKTRLAQEFFTCLSTTLDGAAEAGYWPDALGHEGDNLRVNPKLGDCRPDHPPSFLWWGMRFVDPGARNVSTAALDAELPTLAAHLSVLAAGTRSRARTLDVLRALGDAGLDVALDVAGGGLVKTFGTTLQKLWGIGQEFLADRPSASLDLARQREQASKAERIVTSLAAVLAAREEPLPICILADDGHFAGADPEGVDLLKRLLDAARVGRWPLLLLITHWEREWYGDESPIARWLKPQGDRITLLRLEGVDDLAPMLAARFPGLTSGQQAQILARVDRNPQFLDELMDWLALPQRARHFVGADHRGPLTDRGLGDVLRVSRQRHDLVGERLAEAGPVVCQALSIGSLQGPRFLQDLTAEVLVVTGGCSEEDVWQAIAAAERPHALVRRDGWAADFLQRLYFEVAAEALDGHDDEEKVRAALAAGLRRRVQDPQALAAMDAEARLATLGLTWAVLRPSSDAEDTDTAAAAAALLIAERMARWEFLAAGALAQEVVAAMRAQAAPGMHLDFDGLYDVANALSRIGDWDNAKWAAERLRVIAAGEPALLQERLDAASLLADCLQLDAQSKADLDAAKVLYAEALEIARGLRDRRGTPEAERDLSVALNNVAHAAEVRGDLAAAEALYAEAFDICRGLRERLGTPEAERDVSVALDNVARIAEAWADRVGAEALYAEALDIRRGLRDRLGTLEAERDLSVSLNNVARVVKARGDLEAAEALYAEELDICRGLRDRLGTPQAERDLTLSLDNLSDGAAARGDLGTAEALYAEALDIRRGLRDRLGTPEAERDLAVSLVNVASIAEAKGDLGAAEAGNAEALEIARGLRNRLGTPEAERDVSVALDNAARVAEARGDLDVAEALYTEAFDIRRGLRDRLGTPEAERDVSVSLDHVARVAAARGDLAAAEALYAEALDICRGLRDRLGTPEAERDLVFGYLRLAALAAERGDADAARARLAEARAAIEACSGGLPTSVVARIVAEVDAILAMLG